jgi:hypothetical protein
VSTRMAAVAVGLGLAMVATAAQAHWQYTQWGMSPAQVQVASKGAVGTNPRGSSIASGPPFRAKHLN